MTEVPITNTGNDIRHTEVPERPSAIVGKMAWDISRRENGPLEEVVLAGIQEKTIKIRQQVQEAKERFKAAPKKYPNGIRVCEAVDYRKVKGYGWAEMGSQDNGLDGEFIFGRDLEWKTARRGYSSCQQDADAYATEIVKLEALGLVDPIHNPEEPLAFATPKRIVTGEYGETNKFGRQESETVEILESRKYPRVFLIKTQKNYQETAIGGGRPDDVTEIRWSVVVGDNKHLSHDLKDTSKYKWTSGGKKR